MKRIILLIILIGIAFLLPIPGYRELNDLAIIEGVGLDYYEGDYTVYLKEVIPVKSEQGISYEYQYYKAEGDSFDEAFNRLNKKTKKKLYLKKAKFLVVNTVTSDKVINSLNVKFKHIYHIKSDIYKKLKSID